MALKTSLVITGDAASAKAALDSLDKGLADAGAEAKRLEAAFAAADKSIEQLAAAQTRAKQETLAAKVALQAGSITANEYNARLLETKTALSLVESGHRGAVNALKQAQGALGGAVTSTRAAAAGYTNFGRQVQDVAVQIQSGTNLGTIISQQGGQIADAVAMMGGRFAGLASFLAGPWGAALIVGTGLLVNLGIELLRTGKAADEVKFASLSMSDAQGILANVLDITTGKITTQSTALIALARAQIVAGQIEAQKRQAEARSAITASADFKSTVSGGFGGGISFDRRQGAEAQVESNFRNGVINTDQAVQQLNRLRKAGSITEETFISAAKAYANFGVEQANLDVFKNAEKLLNGTGGRELLKPSKRDRNPKPKQDKSAQLAEYGEDTAKKIANITGQFSDLPSAVTRANKAMRELDDISSDLARRPLTPNVKDLIAEVSQARGVIKESLNRPFNDFLEQSREAVEINKLLLAGREDEAEALKIVLEKQRQQGPLNRDQLETVLATVRASREWSMVLRDQGEIIAANVGAVRDFRGALIGTVADALKGRFSVERILSSIGNSYVNIMSQKLVESLFGDTLRQLESQASGADKVDAAGVRIAGSLDDGAKAVKSFADTVNSASAVISGATAPGGADGAAVASQIAGTVGDALGEAGRNLAEMIARNVNGGAGGNAPETTGDEIVVTASKSKKVDLSGTGAMLLNMVNATLKNLGGGIPKVLLEGLKVPLAKLEQSLPQALQGAFTGSAASKLILGNGGSGVGGAIGGAIGQKLGEKFLTAGFEKVGGKLLGSLAGPLGGVLGGVVGGLLGSAFKKTTSGGASIGITAQGNGGVTGTAGNNADLKKTASGYGGTVVSALDKIVDALGADLGDFKVAIGKRSSGWIKVSASGNAAATTSKKVTSDIVYNGKDEGEAIMAALANALSDGAVKGVSAAVQKALKSSTDVDQAVKTALKVQQVELAIGGIGAQMEKSFRDFERQAAERLKIARDYGFDVVKLEAVNAKDRLKLSEQMLKEQVGSLQDLIKELTVGSLFEGSAVDQRDKLLTEISAAKAKADAGDEGAADTLAQLLQKLNEVSKEAYGTTGGFAADRQTILDAARDTITKANQRVTEAQAATDPAVAVALDENNDQNSQMLAELGLSNDYLQQILAGLSGRAAVGGLAALAKTS